MAERMEDIHKMVEAESGFVTDVLAEMGRVVVGQKAMVERLLIGILSGGHILLEGVPGLAKTLAIKTLAQSVKASFRRIQFTPDMLPADVLGTMIYNQKTGEFLPRKGPIFANLILADEINRAPAKVQSALLEAMQEKQVTLGETTYALEEPFLVLATQNPIEQEGTYPLPEAQVDRFMLKVKIGYPSKAEERIILDRMTGSDELQVQPVISTERIERARHAVRQVYLDEKLKGYIVDLIFATRQPQDYGLKMGNLIEYGASPRATIYLAQAAKSHAFIRHRGYVVPEDVKAVAEDVLRHRVILTYEAEAEEIGPEQVIRQIFDAVEVP
jgi:MoxR-like ATPase